MEHNLGELAELHRARFIGLANIYMNNLADAEDCVQDSFVLALKYGKGFRGDCPVSRWFEQILRNRCLEIIRLYAKRNECQPVSRDDEELWVAPGVDPERSFANREMLAAMEREISLLPRMLKDTIRQLLSGEISNLEYGKYKRRVKSRLFRARRELGLRMRRHGCRVDVCR